MNYISKKNINIYPLLLSLVLSNNLINIFTFYLGINTVFPEFRNIIFILYNGIIFLITLIACIHDKMIFLSKKIIIFFLLFYGYQLISFIMQPNIFHSELLIKSIVFNIPIFVNGWYVIVNKEFNKLFHYIDKLAILYLPFCFLIIYYSIFTNKLDSSFIVGGLNYQNIAMLTFLFFIAKLLDICYMSKKIKVMDIMKLVLYSYIIILTGTRSLYVVYIILLLCCFVHLLSIKQKGRVSILFIPFVCFLLMYNINLPSFSRIHRFDMFVEGIKDGNLVTSDIDKIINEDNLKEDNLKEDVETNEQTEIMNNNISDSNQIVLKKENLINDIYEAFSNQEIKEDTVFNLNGEEVSCKNLFSRTILYKLSLKEILSHPLLGLGTNGFELKYGEGRYPHNFILQLFVELGIPFTLILLCYLLFKCKFLLGFHNKYYYMNFFLLSYIIIGMISGSVWNSIGLTFALVYILCNGTENEKNTI